MPRRSRSGNLPDFVFFDSDAASRAASVSAVSLLRTTPFGSGIPGRTLSLAVRAFRTKPRRGKTQPLPVRAALGGLRLLLLAHLAFFLSTSLCLLVFKSVNPAATTLMAYRVAAYGWKPTPPRFVPLYKIPRTTRTMTVRVEDGNFFTHRGIEPAAIKHAYKLNKGFGEPIYGGSTITMQTARTIFLVPEKSYLRKYLEVIIALEMEAILGKERILELYFNYAEWGKGIFGIEAASRHHYRAGVASLSRDQAIRLVTILSSPIRFSPYNFGRNGILLSRYAYLVKRWGDPPPDPPEAEAPPPPETPETAPESAG